MKEKWFLLNPLYWPIWFIFALLWLITRLPFKVQMSIGRSIGKLLFLFPSSLKKVTEINLSLCYPELSAQDRTTLMKKNFESIGLAFIETAMAWWLPDKKLADMFQLDGLSYAEEAFKKGKGILLVSPHFTSLELVGRIISMKYAFAVMYRPHKKAFISVIHEYFRKPHYAAYIPRHDIRQLLHVLKQNMAVWYAYDIDAGLKRSVFAPFFGIQTASLTALSRLAELSGAAILPIHFYREENKFQYHISLHPPLDHFPSNDVQEDATRMNAILETTIRLKPDQYVWQYKRFKTRPPGEKRFY